MVSGGSGLDLVGYHDEGVVEDERERGSRLAAGDGRGIALVYLNLRRDTKSRFVRPPGTGGVSEETSRLPIFRTSFF
jgi:hypothetical protein